MQVDVLLPGVLREHAGGADELRLDLPDDCDVAGRRRGDGWTTGPSSAAGCATRRGRCAGT